MNIFSFEYADALRGLLTAMSAGIGIGAILSLVRFLLVNWFERRAGD